MNLSTKQTRLTGVKNKLMVMREGVDYGVGKEINWKIGIDTYIPLYIKQITNKDLLYSTKNSIQYSVIIHTRKES